MEHMKIILHYHGIIILLLLLFTFTIEYHVNTMVYEYGNHSVPLYVSKYYGIQMFYSFHVRFCFPSLLLFFSF